MKGMFTEFSLPGVALLMLKNIMILMKQNHRKQLHFSGNTNNHRLESSTQLDTELIWNANVLYFVFISLLSLRASWLEFQISGKPLFNISDHVLQRDRQRLRQREGDNWLFRTIMTPPKICSGIELLILIFTI